VSQHVNRELNTWNPSTRTRQLLRKASVFERLGYNAPHMIHTLFAQVNQNKVKKLNTFAPDPKSPPSCLARCWW
jgi:hypothetical protein